MIGRVSVIGRDYFGRPGSNAHLGEGFWSLCDRRLILEELGLSIHVRDVRGSALVAIPPAEELDYVPAPLTAWDRYPLAQPQISPGSASERFGDSGINESVGQLLSNMGDERAIV
jgi:hypothetical protein